MTDVSIVASVVGLLGSCIFVGIVYWTAHRQGRIAVLNEQASKSVKVKDEQIKIATNRPDKSFLVKRLRDGDF